MLVKMDARSVVSSVFRQAPRFLIVFVAFNALAVAYLLTATPAYESTAGLLVKFGQDARPEVTIEGVQASNLSAEEKRGLIESNLNILTSRDLTQTLLTDITVARAYPELAAEITDPAELMTAAVKQLSADIVPTTKNDAGIINISLFNQNPALATEILTRLLDIFIQKQATIFGNPQTGVLSEQSTDAAKRLEEANRALSDFKVANGITSLDEELTLLLKQRGDLTGYLSRRQDITGDAGNTSATFDALPARINVSGDSARFPVLEDIQKRIDGLRAKESELLQTYRSDSDMVVAVRKNIAAEETALRGTLAALNAQVADLDRQIAEKQQYRTTYEDLVRQVHAREDAYKIAQDRHQSALVNDDLTQRKITRISVIQQPTLPEKSSRPNKAVVLALSILAGGTLAAALSLLSELMDMTFMTTEQLRAVLGRPVLAAFSRRRGVGAVLSRQELAGFYQSVMAGFAEPGSRVIQFVSCYTGEGSSTISRELAQYAGDILKRRVLLVEQSRTAQIGKAGATLLDVASGQAQLAEALVETGKIHQAGLAIDGHMDIAHANLDALQQVFVQLRRNYDLILMPVSGVVQNAGALHLGKLADGVVVVVEAEKTRAPVVQQALERLTEFGGKVLGTVLNKRRYYIPKFLYGRL